MNPIPSTPDISHIAQTTENEKALSNQNTFNKKELGVILNTINEGIVVLSRDNDIMYYNDSFCHQFEIKETIKGKNITHIINNNDFSYFLSTLRETREKKISQEITIDSKTFLLSVNIANNDNPFIIVFHDVSERYALEKTKKDFIINASHELRTPLTSIKGFLELIEKNPKKNFKYIEIIARNTDRIINVINDLLKLSKLEQDNTMLTLETYDINTIIKNNIILFESRMEKKALALQLHLSPVPIRVLIDKLKIEEIIINLIDNAIKYTEKGHISIYTEYNNTHYFIHIKDTGIGIDPKYHTRIFERFFVVDKARSRQTGGTGLGLAIVKHIIGLHKGELQMKSDIGKGTTFTIILPIPQPLQ